MAETIKIHGEECEANTRFGDLKQFDVVWWVGCTWCGGDHRFVLLSWLVCSAAREASGLIKPANGWSVIPLPSCPGGATATFVLTRGGGAEGDRGRVHRVVNPQRDDWADDYELPKRKPAHEDDYVHTKVFSKHGALAPKSKQTSKG